jgi:hypothetical protein
MDHIDSSAIPMHTHVYREWDELHSERSWNFAVISIVTYAVMLGKEYRDGHGRPPIQQFGDALQQITAPVPA